MITIEYCQDGIAVADHKAEEFVRNLVKNHKEAKEAVNTYVVDVEVDVKYSTKVSTENVITIARVLKKEEGINVQFKYKDEILVPNKDGRLHYWPAGFSDFWDSCLAKLL